MAQVDSLFWMWNDIPKAQANSDFYFIQNFDGVQEQLGRFGNKIKNPIVVGPIIMPKPKRTQKKNQLLVNFGGIESSFIKTGKNSNYPFTVTGILQKVLASGTNFDEILFVGCGKIMKQLEKMYAIPNAQFESLPHDVFLKELTASKILLTSPGLTTSFEAFSFGIPAFFLPPQNYSQYWNLNTFNSHGLVLENDNWNTFYPNSNIEKNEPETEGVSKVLNAVNRFEKDDQNKKRLTHILQRVLSSSKSSTKKIQRTQSEFFNSLGGNGADEIAKRIKKF